MKEIAEVWQKHLKQCLEIVIVWPSIIGDEAAREMRFKMSWHCRKIIWRELHQMSEQTWNKKRRRRRKTWYDNSNIIKQNNIIIWRALCVKCQNRHGIDCGCVTFPQWKITRFMFYVPLKMSNFVNKSLKALKLKKVTDSCSQLQIASWCCFLTRQTNRIRATGQYQKVLVQRRRKSCDVIGFCNICCFPTWLIFLCEKNIAQLRQRGKLYNTNKFIEKCKNVLIKFMNQIFYPGFCWDKLISQEVSTLKLLKPFVVFSQILLISQRPQCSYHIWWAGTFCWER